MTSIAELNVQVLTGFRDLAFAEAQYNGVKNVATELAKVTARSVAKGLLGTVTLGIWSEMAGEFESALAKDWTTRKSKAEASLQSLKITLATFPRNTNPSAVSVERFAVHMAYARGLIATL